MSLCCGGRSRPRPELLRHTEVPPRVTETYILSGYRYPDYSLAECLCSAFRPTNETGNFWTHFLPVFVFVYHFAEAFTWEGAPAAGDPFFYPLWSYLVGVLMLLMASSMAHLLNSMSLVVREVCFFVDYGTISAYTVGSSLAYYYYIHPRAGIAEMTITAGSKLDEEGLGGDPEEPLLLQSPWPDFKAFFDDFYIPSSCLVAIICVLSCCNTREHWRKHRYLIRTLVFLLPFLVSSTPIFYRLLVASPYPAASTAFVSSASMPGFFYRHCFWLVVSAVFNISKVPERLFPGRFDLWGHSHQWFHCCTFLSILDELHMIKSEVRALLLSSSLLVLPSSPPPQLPGPTMASTLGVMLLLEAAIASIIAWFSCCANRIYAPQQRDLLANKERCSNHLKCH